MYFKDTANGIITRSGGCFSKTTNGGTNWINYQEFASINSKIGVGDSSKLWITLGSDSVIKTINFFQTYGKQTIPALANAIFALDTSIVYGGRNMTNMIRTTNGGGNYVSVIQISSEVPEEYSLSQNYPNPFNPITNIKYQIMSNVKRETSNVSNLSFGKADVKLIIYDVLGREVEILVNEEQTAGTYEVIWDATNYPSGIYIYKLITGNYTETKKAVLIK